MSYILFESTLNKDQQRNLVLRNIYYISKFCILYKILYKTLYIST